MKIDLDRLRVLFQGYAASKRPPDRCGCPSPRAIASSFKPSFSNREQKKIADHVSECQFCRDEFMMFLEVQKLEPESFQSESRGTHDIAWFHFLNISRPLRWITAWRYACVLIGLAFVISSFVLNVQQKSTPEVQRASQSGLNLLFPKIDQRLTAPPIFRWQKSVSSDYYVIELFDERMLPVWSSDKIRQAQLTLPPEVYWGLQVGKTYYWMVTGFSVDSRIEESNLSRFIRSR